MMPIRGESSGDLCVLDTNIRQILLKENRADELRLLKKQETANLSKNLDATESALLLNSIAESLKKHKYRLADFGYTKEIT